jgi:hypothetical protein
MSQTIKTIDGKDVEMNLSGSSIAIGDYEFRFSQLLPVILHYIKGGLFGHAVITRLPTPTTEMPIMYLSAEELKDIEKFIKLTGTLKKQRLQNGNTAFFIPSKTRKKRM